MLFVGALCAHGRTATTRRLFDDDRSRLLFFRLTAYHHTYKNCLDIVIAFDEQQTQDKTRVAQWPLQITNTAKPTHLLALQVEIRWVLMGHVLTEIVGVEVDEGKNPVPLYGRR